MPLDYYRAVAAHIATPSPDVCDAERKRALTACLTCSYRAMGRCPRGLAPRPAQEAPGAGWHGTDDEARALLRAVIANWDPAEPSAAGRLFTQRQLDGLLWARRNAAALIAGEHRP